MLIRPHWSLIWIIPNYYHRQTNPCNISDLPPTEFINPCSPSPCGANARCSDRNRAAACQCIPDYFGDPYVACRPECVVHSDCPSDKACQRNKCVDPCPGTCGVNAACRVLSHVATCTCLEGYEGDPFSACRLRPLSKSLFVSWFCPLHNYFQNYHLNQVYMKQKLLQFICECFFCQVLKWRFFLKNLWCG